MLKNKELVKIPRATNYGDLEEKINEFIKELDDAKSTYEIININLTETDYGNHAAMIRYKCIVERHEIVNLDKGDEE